MTGEQVLRLHGRLIAQVEKDDPHYGRGQQHRGWLFLFRAAQEWTVLSVRHTTRWSEPEGPELQPIEGWGSAGTQSFSDLGSLKAFLERELQSGDMRRLAQAGAQNDDELRALWTPVQIELDLDRSSIHRREFAIGGSQRGRVGWEDEALELAVERLTEIGFNVLQASTEARAIFSRGLGKAWERTGNVIVGAVVSARYGYRVDLVVAVDSAGEVYVRTADPTLVLGARRRNPPRPLTDAERRQLKER
jgi:hypothetical protein